MHSPATNNVCFISLLLLSFQSLIPFSTTFSPISTLARPSLPPRRDVYRLHSLPAHQQHQRNLIVLSHNVSQHVVDGTFPINELLNGRVDVLTRCANAALWVSNGIRKDTTVYLMLFPYNVTIEIQGRNVQQLNPDERTMALHLKRTLLSAGSSTTAHQQYQQKQKPLIIMTGETSERETRPNNKESPRNIQNSVDKPDAPVGFILHHNDTLDKRLDAVAAQHDQSALWILQETGDDLFTVATTTTTLQQQQQQNCSTTFVLGDHRGYAQADIVSMMNMKRPRSTTHVVSLGPVSLLTSHCIAILHNYLDRLLFV